jgi:hypothetical protein
MKKIVAVAFLTPLLIALGTRAQLTPPPPSSLLDGILISTGAINLPSWQSSVLANYQLTPGNPFQTPSAGSTDIYGNVWTSAAPDKNVLNQQAGTLRLVFLGTATKWDGAIGYTYSGSPAAPGTYSLAQLADTLSFGNCADINLGVGEPASFDLWLSGGDNTFCLFQPGNSLPTSSNGSVLWTRDPLLVSTYSASDQTFENVATWIASVSEQPANPANPPLDYRVAVQFFYSEGHFVDPVPEPSTYGLASALVLGALVLRRCRRAK